MLNYIYNHSPIIFQNLMVSIKGKIFMKQRYTKHYFEEIKRLRECNDLFELQNQRFEEFYNYIKKNSEFYSEIIKKNNLSDKKITVANINQLPEITKDDIRKNVDNIITKKKNKLIKMGTGGSTGKSMVFYTNAYDMSRKIAYLDYFKEQHGVYKGMKRVSVGGRKIVPIKQKKKVFWRYNKPLNQLMISAYHADGENLKYYIKKLNKFQPETLDGYTTVIHRIAKYILDNNIELNFTPIAIFPSAETLTDLMRDDIEKAFNCPVRNQYASSEGAPFITENKEDELEINVATGVFEFKKIHGNIYELIVTGFYTTTTPLLRYKIGDSVELENELPVNYQQKDIKIKRIIGRNNDFLQSREKGIVTNVNLSTAIRFVENDVIESQFVQNEIDNIIVYLVISNDADKNNIIKKLKYELEFRFGTSTNFHFEFVSKIPSTSGGKKRFAINNIK
ncbi:phenylacetate--CoA ligase family protein [Staphylococcus saprophyticus]|jgi:phenylacetate-CoA ligase|nr:phenylacetate--CoA ligase family protein [Staphylococcus saprophyticus]MBC2958273.1 phenylacetate--CoA ligase family protein [Staphylococcus saprophyticus]MBC3008299.1 phenylacetate--CoA ligase family protein [Staphylococcus saprophyticus]MBC3022610.1 phenylacetate--CoA ligase family protein [Staphylococcus saprophyticus]MBC3031258.1 phenylacetate--CoA ligase family protein [Staphylococcus saprophyticus]